MTPNETYMTAFLESLLEIARGFGGEDIIDRFQSVKTEREKYLSEQWKDQVHDIGPAITRNIDFEQLLVLLYKKLPEDSPELFEAKLAVVKLCLQFNEYEKARSILEPLSKEEQSVTRQATIAMHQGKLALLRNRYDASAEHYKKAVNLYSRTQNYRGQASAYNNLGIISHEQWQSKTGKTYFNKAKNLFPNIQDQQLKISVNINLGIVNGIQGEYEKAYEIFNDLLRNIDEKNSVAKLQLLINKGISARDAGKLEESMDALKLAIDLSNNVKNGRFLALSKHGLAETFVLQGNLKESSDSLISAFKIFSKIHDKIFIADTYRVFGLLHIERGQYELAESEIEISLRINNESGNIPNLAESYKAYSRLADIRGDTARQKEFLHKAISLCETMQATKRVERLQKELERLQN